MKTTEIGFWSNDSEVIRFNLIGPDVRNPYTIKSITGLDADEIVPQYYSSGLVSGNKFNELALSPREITVRIDMKPNYRANQHPADLRGKILKAIASSRTGTVQMRFYDGGICWGAITGFITKFENPVTTRDTEVQFTIRCPDPILRSLTITSQIVSELDLDYPILTDPVSTSPHGFKLKLTFTGSINPFIIQDDELDWLFKINYAFLSGDELYFSSEFGDKYLYRIRSAVTLNLMDVLDPDSIWPMLFPGENTFNVNTTSFNWNDVYWYETHWGI